MQDFSMITERFTEHKGFILETHLHTKTSSACSSLRPEVAIKMYKKAGYDGVIITDHFMTGNTSVDKTLPWEEQVDSFFEGFEQAKAAGEIEGIKVFEGLEYSDYGTDFIVLGLDRDWIKAHPEMTKMEPEEFLPFFREAGATIIQAHPFREASYIREVRVYPDYVDAIEVYNIGNHNSEFDHKAYDLAVEYHKPMTAGSDCHHFGDENFGAGIMINKEPRDINDLCNIIKEGKDYKYFGG